MNCFTQDLELNMDVLDDLKSEANEVRYYMLPRYSYIHTNICGTRRLIYTSYIHTCIHTYIHEGEKSQPMVELWRTFAPNKRDRVLDKRSVTACV